MKEKLKSYIKRLLGISVPVTVGNSYMSRSGGQSGGEEVQNQQISAPVRLTRLPFFLAHLFSYAVLFFIAELLQNIFAASGRVYSLGGFGFTAIIFVVTVLLTPVYVRRAHDIGWSLKYVFLLSVLPAFLRLFLLLIPLIGLLNQSVFGPLLQIMPFVGIVFWALRQIQLGFFVVLLFAPSTGVHNRYGDRMSSSFTLGDLYGFSLFKKKKLNKDK